MKNSDLVVMTTAEAKPGKENSVQQALCDVAKAARVQSGCIEYSILCSTENPAVTVNFERWASKAERDTFLAGADVKEFTSAVSGAFVESPQPKSISIPHTGVNSIPQAGSLVFPTFAGGESP